MVNPRACYETTLKIASVNPKMKQKLAVIGAGPAGLAFATTAAQRGHDVTLFEKDAEIGGQFNMAKLIPGKEEFYETLRYFNKQIEINGINLKLNTVADVSKLNEFDSVIIATGVHPRDVSIPNKSTKVNSVSYLDVLKNNAFVGKKVAVIGAGGIGFDISDFITHVHKGHHKHGVLEQHVDHDAVNEFISEWGIDSSINKGGLLPKAPVSESARKVYLLQRKKGKIGAGLGKTTGWIHRSTMKKRHVEEISGCKYIEINDNGLIVEIDGKQRILEVDTVIFCAGQESERTLHTQLKQQNGKQKLFMIGGAQEAGELDAKRAIDQGTRLAAVIETAKSGDVFETPVEFTAKVMKKLQDLKGAK